MTGCHASLSLPLQVTVKNFELKDSLLAYE